MSLSAYPPRIVGINITFLLDIIWLGTPEALGGPGEAENCQLVQSFLAAFTEFAESFLAAFTKFNKR